MKDLSKIPIEVLLAEVERRHKDVEDYHKTLKSHSIKTQITKKKLTLAVQYIKGGDYGPNFILGIIKKGKFLDFYYNSGMENFHDFIPDGFHECMESTYEYQPSKKNMSLEKTVEEALSVLKEAGYTNFEEIYE